MDIERAIVEIQKRNARVEADKVWETSLTRRASIAAIVFFAAWAWLSMQGSGTALRDALFPPCGYLLSTIALSRLRVQWEAHQSRNNHDTA